MAPTATKSASMFRLETSVSVAIKAKDAGAEINMSKALNRLAGAKSARGAAK